MTASRSTNASRCAPPEWHFPENRPEGDRRRSLPPGGGTDADAEMSALGAEPASFPRKNVLRKTPGKPVIRKNRHLF